MDVFSLILGSGIGVSVAYGYGLFLSKKDENVPRILPAKNSCEKNHIWSEIEMQFSEERARNSTLVCQKCGVLAKDLTKMINSFGLEELKRQEVEIQEREALTAKIAPKLEFDMGLYYDIWIKTHGEAFKEAMADVSKTEELHQIMSSFLVRGQQYAVELQRRIGKEILEEERGKGS